MQYVFISYSRRDSDIMQVVRDRLRAAGFNVWTDENLEPGTPSWVQAIVSALYSSCAVVALLSPDACKSQWVERELIFAQQNEVPVYPLLVRGDQKNAVPILLITAQFVDARQDLHSAVTEIIKALLKTCKSEPKKEFYIVDQTGRGDFRSIAEALAAVPESAIIKVRPGLYRESLTLNKAVKILGDGERDKIIVQTEGKDCVQMLTNSASIQGISFHQKSPRRVAKVCVYAPQGLLLLENCCFTSESSSCIDTCNNGTITTIRRCTIRLGRASGIYVHTYAVAIIEESGISENSLGGIVVEAGASSVVRACVVTRNGNEAICVRDHSKSTVEDCDLRGNAGGAWYIDETSSVTRLNNLEE
jgi:hypothetical protein